jgi:hypothetical protein
MVQTSFASGEISERALGRTDLKQYGQAARTLRNFIAHRHGGASKRSGTRYVANTKSNNTGRIVKFAYSDDQQYILEFTNLFIRFYRFSGGVPAQLLNAGPPTEIGSPYLAADLPSLKFCQSADVLIITHPSYAPYQLARIGVTDTDPASWSLTTIPLIDGPYGSLNISATTISSNVVGPGAAVLTASTGIFENPVATGRWVRLLLGGPPAVWGWAQIVAPYISATQANVTIVQAFGAAGVPTVNWRRSVIYDYANKRPAAASFHQGRLYFASTNIRPSEEWGSNVDNFYTFSPSGADGMVSASHSVDVSIDDDRVNVIRWLLSDKLGLIAMNASGQSVYATSQDAALTPTNGTMRRHNVYGCHATARPQRIGPRIVFWQADRKLRDLGYDYTSDRLEGSDIAILAEHVGLPGVVDTAWQENFEGILWTVLVDGTLAGVTLERDEQVIAWHRHTASGTSAFIESIEVIRNGGVDYLWLLVRRTIGGLTKRMVEVLQPSFDHNTAPADAWMLDAGLQYSGAPSMVISGMDHLNGEMVSVLGDGAQEPDALVVAGVVTLTRAVSKATIGLKVLGQLDTLPLVFVAPFESRFRPKNVQRLVLTLWRSLGGSLQFLDNTQPVDQAWEIIYREADTPPLSPPDLFTGNFVQPVSGVHSRDPAFRITHDGAQPFSILAFMAEVNLGAF